MRTALYFVNRDSEATIEELRRGWESLKKEGEGIRAR